MFKIYDSYRQLPKIFYRDAQPTPVREPKVWIINELLAQSLTIELGPREVIAAYLSGNQVIEGSKPLAQAYAGHQFGHFNALGDGRAMLIGDLRSPDGAHLDVHLKGAGPTPFARRGDGRAALGPILREYLMSEAMHALGIPTSRSLAVVSTGEWVLRDQALPGAVLTRLASSHVRVGTFEWAAYADPQAAPSHLQALAAFCIERHGFDCSEDPARRYVDFWYQVASRQAKLIAQWMAVGFVHGVMNTDNMSIAGETLDYGPCAWLDRFDWQAVFSSIDRQGRYAYANQPSIGAWNLRCLFQALLPLLKTQGSFTASTEETMLEEGLRFYAETFESTWLAILLKKLGLFIQPGHDEKTLIMDYLNLLHHLGADYTESFRCLMRMLDHLQQHFSDKQAISDEHLQTWLADTPTLLHAGIYTEQQRSLATSPDWQAWCLRWWQAIQPSHKPLASSLCLMRSVNPAVVPRNAFVEAALADAVEGNEHSFHQLLQALQQPYCSVSEENSIARRDYRRIPPYNASYQTFCGT